MSTSQRCIICLKANATPCETCGTVAYCSEDCKEKDSFTHDLLCEKLKDFGDEQRPSTHHVRVILFPWYSREIEFRWLNASNFAILENAKALLYGSSASGQTVETTSTYDNPRTGERVGNGRRVRFVHRGICRMDGSPLNQSAYTAMQDSLVGLTNTFSMPLMNRRLQQMIRLGWLGNVVAYAEMGDGDVLDIIMKDLRNIIDHLRWLPFQPGI